VCPPAFLRTRCSKRSALHSRNPFAPPLFAPSSSFGHTCVWAPLKRPYTCTNYQFPTFLLPLTLLLPSPLHTHRYSVFAIWAGLGAWEYHHIKHKIHTDRVLAGEQEVDEERRGGGKWEKVWGKLNRLVEEHAVPERSASVSSVYVLVAGLASWGSVVPAFVSLALLFVLGGDSNVVFLLYELSGAVQITACGSMCAYMLLNLDCDESGGRAWAIYTSALGAGLLIPVGVGTLGGVQAENVFALGVFLFVGAFIRKLRKRAISTMSEERRRQHVYGVVFPSLLKVIAPLTFMVSEMTMCWLKAWMDAEKGGWLLKDTRECVGVKIGVSPLMLLLCTVAAWPIVSLKGGGVMTVENVSARERSEC